MRRKRAGWTRPRLSSEPVFPDLRGAATRWSSAALKRAANESPFVANDCDLSHSETVEGRAEDQKTAPIWLLTGPNMAGKSTYLRQNALIAVLAQMGAFVPAAEAEVGVVDQLFSRVGASDDLARGRSTFMVEMVETAAILNQAGPKSLVILDEIGRGTATYDGLAIAWAALEHLHDANRCRGLFATHYHELNALTGQRDGLRAASVAVREWQGAVIFLHEVRPAPPIAPMACRWHGSPDCRSRWWHGRGRCWRSWRRAHANRAPRRRGWSMTCRSLRRPRLRLPRRLRSRPSRRASARSGRTS